MMRNTSGKCESFLADNTAGMEEDIQYYDEPVDDFVGEVHHFSRG